MDRTSDVAAVVFRVGLVLWFAALPFSAVAQTPLPSAATPNASPVPISEAYFLIQYTSVQLPGGVRGIAPGTPITIVEDCGPILRVRADDAEFEVRKDQVTKDALLARQISETDAHSQRQTVESLRAQKERILQQQQQQQAEQNRITAQANELRGLEARYRALQDQEGELLLKIGKAKQSHPWFNLRGRVIHHQPDETHPQLPSLESRLADVRHEKEEARRHLEEAQRRYQQPR
jgi:hypothetical protein